MTTAEMRRLSRAAARRLNGRYGVQAQDDVGLLLTLLNDCLDRIDLLVGALDIRESPQ